MPRRFVNRLTTALVVVLSLLFSQLAVANYACPAESSTASMAAMMASGMPCDGMDKAQPALCHEHGAATPQSFEAAKVPAPTLPMILQVLALPLVPDAQAAPAATVAGVPEGRPPRDPLFLATLRLRV